MVGRKSQTQVEGFLKMYYEKQRGDKRIKQYRLVVSKVIVVDGNNCPLNFVMYVDIDRNS